MFAAEIVASPRRPASRIGHAAATLRERLVRFAYRGQLGPSSEIEWQDFSPRR